MLIRGLIEDFQDRPPPSDHDDFMARLRLKQIDRDVFTGWCHAGSPLRAFGGQVAAQALVAAGATVAGDREVHSLHSYFLRPGRTTDHIVYMVDRPRDGRSFTTRRVRAIQYGEIIFALSASFAGPQDGPTHQRGGVPPAWWGAVPDPRTLLPERVFDHVSLAAEADPAGRKEALADAGYPTRQLFDLRIIEPSQVFELAGGLHDRMVWVRSVQDLPEANLPHVCVLTYFSDLNMVGTILGQHGGRRSAAGLEVASLDHAMWFHAPFRSDQWMLFTTDSPASGGGRGFARGEFYRADGVLAASAAQEALIRQPFNKG